MTQIRTFKDLSIKPPETKQFIGDKIAVRKLLGHKIIVHDYKIEPSKFEGERLKLQITYKDDKRIVFTSAGVLKETIKQVPKENLPFTTVIIEEEKIFQFT